MKTKNHLDSGQEDKRSSTLRRVMRRSSTEPNNHDQENLSLKIIIKTLEIILRTNSKLGNIYSRNSTKFR